MSKTSKRFDETIYLQDDESLDSIRSKINAAFAGFEQYELDGWDIDWPNVEIHTEREEISDPIFSDMGRSFEQLSIHFSFRGRK